MMVSNFCEQLQRKHNYSDRPSEFGRNEPMLCALQGSAFVNNFQLNEVVLQ